MTSNRFQDIALGATLGALVGTIPAMLAAGAYVSIRYGASISDTDMWTYTNALPGLQSVMVPGDFQTGAFIGLGVLAAATMGGVALLLKSELSSQGTARWAKTGELRGNKLLARDIKAVRGPVWAKLGGPRSVSPYLSSEEVVHSLICAPTGAGKGVGVVIPVILTYAGSLVILDVKAENYDETARRRFQMHDRVFKFSPCAKDARSHRYNPLDVVVAASERGRYGAAITVANGLLVPMHGLESWIGGSREILAAAIVTAIEQGQSTMAAVYDLISTPVASMNELFSKLADMTKNFEAKSIFQKYVSMEQRTLTAYVSILNDGGLRIWADPQIRDATAESDFEITSFRRDPASLYLCVSPTDIEKLAPLLRLMLQQMFAALEGAKPGQNDAFPILFILDEFTSLGRMNELSRAITILRSAGGRLMLIVQSLANLSGPYGKEGMANFMGNCDLQLYMAPTDMETPKFLSEAIGSKTIKKKNKTSRKMGFDGAQITDTETGVPLIRPEQVRLIGKDAIIALIRNVPPVLARRIVWFEDPALKQLHKEQEKISMASIEPDKMPETSRAGQIWRSSEEVKESSAEPEINQPDLEKTNPSRETNAPAALRLVRRIETPTVESDSKGLDAILSGQEKISKYAKARQKLHKRT